MSDIELHRKLLGDRARNQAFHAALARSIRPGKTTVVDLGAGTGFLSFLAARLGAAHCTLVEYADSLRLAQQLARANRLTHLTFVAAHSAEVRKPPKADLVVSETLGNYALEENLLETMVDARRYLAPGGTLIPARLRQYVAPVTDPRLQRGIDVWADVGFDIDLSAARRISLNNMYVKTVLPSDLPGAGSVRVWDDLDFSPDRDPPSSRRTKAASWKDPGTVHGFALWWECELIKGVAISTSPFEPATHWEQVYLPLLEPVSGGSIELSLTSDTRREVGVRLQWKVRALNGRKVVSEQSLDTFAGRL